MADGLNGNPEDFVGCTCFSLIHGTDKPPAFCPHSELLKDKKYHLKEFRSKSLQGDFSVSVFPTFNDNNQLTGSVHVVHDITERKKLEKSSDFFSVYWLNIQIMQLKMILIITSWNKAAEKCMDIHMRKWLENVSPYYYQPTLTNDLDYIIK